MNYLWDTFSQNFFVSVFVNLLSIVMRFQNHFDLFDRTLLTLNFFQEL